MRLAILAPLLLLLAVPASAQETQAEAPPLPCSEEQFRQLDFWIGEWVGTWKGGEGTNVITAVLGDCVIEENFEGNMAAGFLFRGMSVSTYDTEAGLWKQTWVDNQGSYLDFTGGPEGDTFVFSREARAQGKTFHQRMVFLNITGDAFDWSWERSTDGGETWNQTWLIRYRRAGT